MKTISVIDMLYPAPKDGDSGKDGNDGVSYSIVCSNNNPNVTDNAAVITLTAYKTTGNKRGKITMDDHLCFGLDGEYYYSNPMTVVIAKGATTKKEVQLIGDDNLNPLAICTISPVVNGANGTNVMAQYCPSKTGLAIGAAAQPDASQAHSSFQSGDEWMRTKAGDDSDWSQWFRIVGEGGTDGEYTDYTFNLSKDDTVADAYTCPGNLVSDTWTDAPKIPTTDYPYLWMRMQRMNVGTGVAVMEGRKYTYCRLTGEKGADGKDGKDGTKFVPKGTALAHYEKADDVPASPLVSAGSSNIYLVDDETDPARFYNGAWGSVKTDVGDAYIIDSDIWVWLEAGYWKDLGQFVGPQGARGPAGEDGKSIVGPMAYYAGEWQKGVTYTRTADITPLVTHGDDDYFYYPKEEVALLNSEPSADNSQWSMCQKVPIILAKLLMADFGKIASAIFVGNYMISQYGILNGTEVGYDSDVKDTAYTNFDDRDDDNVDGSAFVPNLSINFLTGYIKALKLKAENMESKGGTFENVKVSGTVAASLFYGKTKTIESQEGFTYAIDPATEPYTCFFFNEPWVDNTYFVTLPDAATYDGLEIQIYIKWQSPTTRSVYTPPRVYVKCSNTDDHLYAKQNSALVDKVQVENVGSEYTDFKGTTLLLQTNAMSKFKSIAGSWYAIDGIFTGE